MENDIKMGWQHEKTVMRKQWKMGMEPSWIQGHPAIFVYISGPEQSRCDSDKLCRHSLFI
jgi:hypothetical protein